MGDDKLDSQLILFPCVYFGLATFYSSFEIYLLGNYEPKDGRWGSFQISLAIWGFMTLLASLSYWICLECLEAKLQEPRGRRLTLITTLSSSLSWVILLTFFIFEPGIASSSILLYLLFWAAAVCLPPALIGVSLVKINQSHFTAHPPIQR